MELIVIKVESCQKSREFWMFFSPSHILGGGPSENGTHIVTPALRHVDWKKFREGTPTSPKVICGSYAEF